MKKTFLTLFASILLFALIFTPTANETAQAKTMWGKIELKKGMVGKVKILKDTYQYSISKNKLKKGSKLKKGKEYGVYSYSKNYSGLYKLSGSNYVKKSSSIKYLAVPKTTIPKPSVVQPKPVTNFSLPISIIADDGKNTFLGLLTSNKYDSDGIFNQYGSYGSKYSSTSIWNQYSQFGSLYATYSAFNQYATRPPLIVDQFGNILGRVTVNSYISDGINPESLYNIAVESGL